MASDQEPVQVLVRSTSERICAEHALVLRAVGIPCAVQRDRDGFMLVVEAHDASRAQAELDAYARENRDTSGGDSVLPRRSDGWAGVLSYAAVILLAAVCEDRNMFSLDWFGAGKTSAQLIREGQWWRTVTALTLHADPAHLLANLVVGGLFGLFAAQMLGSGLAWFSILVAGAAGNAINAWVRSVEHTSVGASTAVFAALGIVSAFAWTGRGSSRTYSMVRWTPVIGGVVLFSYLGLGGGKTDVAAHVAGLLCGLLLGTAYGKLGVPGRLRSRGQALLAMSAVALIALGWVLALIKAGDGGGPAAGAP